MPYKDSSYAKYVWDRHYDAYCEIQGGYLYGIRWAEFVVDFAAVARKTELTLSQRAQLERCLATCGATYEDQANRGAAMLMAQKVGKELTKYKLFEYRVPVAERYVAPLIPPDQRKFYGWENNAETEASAEEIFGKLCLGCKVPLSPTAFEGTHYEDRLYCSKKCRRKQLDNKIAA